MKSASTTRMHILQTFESRTNRSRTLYEQALRSLPGGDTRSSTYFRPYPIFMEQGKGCRLRDVDGNEYLDFLNNYTTLVHGHAHPEISRVIAVQASRGTAYAAPDENQIALADAITRRVDSVERVRFCNSGTEAVMNALRVARAFTGRSKILKMEGGFHGTHDSVQVSVDPGSEPRPWPLGRAEGGGLSPGMVDEVLVAPFNDIETTSRLIRSHQDEAGRCHRGAGHGGGRGDSGSEGISGDATGDDEPGGHLPGLRRDSRPFDLAPEGFKIFTASGPI